MSVYLECKKIGSKLRVNITSPGYNNVANCQFPRAIRVEGRKYKVPPEAIKVARGSAGKFFYRISKNLIEVLGEEVNVPEKIYESEECMICMENECEIIFAQCGHLCTCQGCADELKTNSRILKCIMCRQPIEQMIHKSNFR
jgi:hypothetical protein